MLLGWLGFDITGRVVSRLRGRTRGHGHQHPDRVPRRRATHRTASCTGPATTACVSDHRRLPAERGGHHHRDRRSLPRTGLSGLRGDRGIQHTAPSGRRGRAEGDRGSRSPARTRCASKARSPRPRTSTPRWRTWAASSSVCSMPITTLHPVRSTGHGAGWRVERAWCKATA